MPVPRNHIRSRWSLEPAIISVLYLHFTCIIMYYHQCIIYTLYVHYHVLSSVYYIYTLRALSCIIISVLYIHFTCIIMYYHQCIIYILYVHYHVLSSVYYIYKANTHILGVKSGHLHAHGMNCKLTVARPRVDLHW